MSAHSAFAYRTVDAESLSEPGIHHQERHCRPGGKVIDALAKGSFSRAQFLKNLDPYYKAIEREGANLSHFTERQDFLNSVYEQFFQRVSPDIADTPGIVYPPRELVDYMCNSVERALNEEFGLSLASPEVVILDPCTGTGNFIQENSALFGKPME